MTSKQHLSAFDAPSFHKRSLVTRINALAISRKQESAAAFSKAPGRQQDVQRLILADSGIFPLTPQLENLRTELGLPSPVVPSAQEHSELSRRLYKARDLDTASAIATGG